MPDERPDDLARLDDDLAAGRIDASTFRRRRDALLAGDLGPAPPAPAPPPSPASPPVPAPVQAAAPFGADPERPGARWDPSVPTAATVPPVARPAEAPGAARRHRPSPPVPPHLTTPPWTRTGPAAPTPAVGPRPRMQGSEVFAPGPPRAVAVLGTVLVVALALAVLVVSFLL